MEDNGRRQVDVTVYVDPSCPYAWITSRWLREVERLGAIRLTVDLMSVSVINEHREIEDWYREFCDRAWGPSRVALTVREKYGEAAFAALYEAIGRRRHNEQIKPTQELMPPALAEAGLPAELLCHAWDPAHDDELRRRTAKVQALVGGDLGTPTVLVDGRAFFGPVLMSVPRGQQALDVFSALRTLAGTAGFAELAGARRGELVFD